MHATPIHRPRPYVLVLALLACVALSAQPAAAAAPTAAQTLTLLKARLGTAAKAGSAHHVLSRASYVTLRASALRLRASLIAPPAKCRSALAAAERLAADRSHPARLAADARIAHLGIAACVIPPVKKQVVLPPVAPTPPPVVPPATPPVVVAPSIDGTVVDSAGRPLPSLPLEVTVVTSPRGPFYGKSVFQTVTGADGSFAIAQDPAALGALAYTAIAAFPWHGGTWSRGLVLTGGDAQHLAFQVTLTHTVDPYSGAYDNEGSKLKFFDIQGCTQLSANPAYPASDRSTSSLTLTFLPDGPLVDGTTGTAQTVTIATLSLCSGAFVELPAGAWSISGVSDGGRQLAFAHTGALLYVTSYPVFEVSPDTGELEPSIDVHFA